jgi:hypothetical protein
LFLFLRIEDQLERAIKVLLLRPILICSLDRRHLRIDPDARGRIVEITAQRATRTLTAKNDLESAVLAQINALRRRHGVAPLRLGTDEERNKLNEMLRTDTPPVAFGMTFSQNISVAILLLSAILYGMIRLTPPGPASPPITGAWRG